MPEIAVSYGEKLGHLPVGSVNDLWEIQARKYNYQAKYLAYWQKAGVDAVICPAAPSASYPQSAGKYFGYTGVWNVLDYAVTAVRTRTRCDAKVDVDVPREHFFNDFDKNVASDCESQALS